MRREGKKRYVLWYDDEWIIEKANLENLMLQSLKGVYIYHFIYMEEGMGDLHNKRGK